MNARDSIENLWDRATPVGPLLDAYRLAVIAERDAQIIEWLTKKAHEEGTSNKECRTRADVLFRMADKMSRGAVRPPLSKGPEPHPEGAVRRALEPMERLALAFENTGEPEIGCQIRAAIKAGTATQ